MSSPIMSEDYNRYKSIVEKARDAVSRHIQYLLKPDDGYPKGTDYTLKVLYNEWRDACREMDIAYRAYDEYSARHEMIPMPPDDAEHYLCRRMAAVIIERYVFEERNAEKYLPSLIEQVKASNCHTHPNTCACHSLRGWTYGNTDLVRSLEEHYVKKIREAAVGGGPLSHQPAMGGGAPLRVSCGGWRDCSCGCCFGGGGAPAVVAGLRRSDEHVYDCACGACHRVRVAEGTQDAYMARLRAQTDMVLGRNGGGSAATTLVGGAKAMPGSSADDEFVKNLFQTVQGVKFDDKCPHDLPFYACMSCSH